MEKLILNKKTFDQIILMLNSPDKENVVLGLTCIEELDTYQGLVYLLLMKKLANVTNNTWVEHAPKKTTLLKSMGVSVEDVLTYKKILDLLAERKASTKDIEFYLSKFGEYLKSTLIELGYDTIDAVEINIKLKLNENKPSRKPSQNIKELDA